MLLSLCVTAPGHGTTVMVPSSAHEKLPARLADVMVVNVDGWLRAVKSSAWSGRR